MEMKYFVDLCVKEQRDFLDSFDVILSDLDGVIWLGYQPIPGAAECVATLKGFGKEYYYVTNNSCVTIDFLLKKLNDNGFSTKLDDIASPVSAIISYLKKINFKKEIFTVSTKYFRQSLKRAGFLLADEPPSQIEDSLDVLYTYLNDDESIGAVVVDTDFNMNFVKIQKAITYLRRQNCLFLVGCGDKQFPSTKYGNILGLEHILNILKEFSGKEPILFGKPNENFNDFIIEKFNINKMNANRVLYIGDTINEDLKFATLCGYQKLLVLTGNTTKNDVENWTYLEEYKPHYYVESLKVLDTTLKNIF